MIIGDSYFIITFTNLYTLVTIHFCDDYITIILYT